MLRLLRQRAFVPPSCSDNVAGVLTLTALVLEAHERHQLPQMALICVHHRRQQVIVVGDKRPDLRSRLLVAAHSHQVVRPTIDGSHIRELGLGLLEVARLRSRGPSILGGNYLLQVLEDV